MAMYVYNNNPSLISQQNLAVSNAALGRSVERISTGERINHAQDDAANIAISDRLRVQLGGVLRASLNAQDAISFLQTAEGGMEAIGDILHRMHELAIQASNGTYTDNDRSEIQSEVDQLKSAIDQIANSSEYNAKKLLSGTAVGLWSSNANELDAIMRSDVKEGNYRFKFSVDPGQNAVYKTNVLFDGATIEDVYKNAGLNSFNDLRQSNRTTDLIPYQQYRPEMDSIFQVRGVAPDMIPEVFGDFIPMLDKAYALAGSPAAFDTQRSMVTLHADVLGTYANEVNSLRNQLQANGYRAQDGDYSYIVNYSKAYFTYDDKMQDAYNGLTANDVTYNMHPSITPNNEEILASSGTFVFSNNSGNYTAQFTDSRGKTSYFTGTNQPNGIQFVDDDPVNNGRSLTIHAALANKLAIMGPTDHIVLDNIDTGIPMNTPGQAPEIAYIELQNNIGSWDDNNVNNRSRFHLAVQEVNPYYAGYGTTITYYGTDFVDGQRQDTGMIIHGMNPTYGKGAIGSIDYRAHLDEVPEILADLVWHTTPTNRTDFFMSPLSTGLTPNGLDTAEEAGVANVRANGDADDLFSAAFAFTNVQQAFGASVLETFTTGYPGNSFVENGNLIQSISSSKTGYIQVEFTNNNNFADIVTPPSNTGRPIQATFTFIDAETGEHSIIQFDQMGSSVSYTANITFEVGKAVTLDFQNGVRARIKIDDTGYDVTKGDKMLFAVNATRDYDIPLGSNDIYVTVNTEGNGGSRVQNPTVLLKDGMTKGSTITTVMLKDGQFLEASLAWDVINTGVKLDNYVTLERYHSKNPEAPKTLGDVRLGDLPIFTTTDGRHILDKTQTLTIYCNDRQVDVTIEARDTVRELAEKLGAALADGLDVDIDGILNSDLVSLVTSSRSGHYAALGTIVIQTALVGDGSKLNFKGDERLLDILGFNTIQQAENSEVNVTVLDAHTNQVIGSDVIQDQMLRGVIEGVDVRIDSRLGVKMTFDTGTGEMLYTADEWNEVFLHIVNQRTDVQVGANEGIKIDISVERVDTLGLGVNDVYVTKMKDSQAAITKIELAKERLNAARAKLGAQVNRMDNAMKMLKYSSMGMTSTESRIRDLDVADESAALARNQILVNAGVAMVAQANQAPSMAMQLISGN